MAPNQQLERTRLHGFTPHCLLLLVRGRNGQAVVHVTVKKTQHGSPQ